MKNNLSVLIITKNAGPIFERCLKSVYDLADEILIIDNYSFDTTLELAKKYAAKIYLHEEEDLGKQKAWGLKKSKGKWVLVLDSDEMVSEKLKKEIKSILRPFHGKRAKNDKSAYEIKFQNHFLGRPVRHGGENYKMLRLFKKGSVVINPSLVHEKFKIKKGEMGKLKNKIYHYSYRSLRQMYIKFTDYAIRDAKIRGEKGEKSSLKKIFIYPLHMFYARFIKDKGYKDGLFRIPLDLGFAYMEFLTYFLLSLAHKKKRVG